MDFVFRHTSFHTHHAAPETLTGPPTSPAQPPPQPPSFLEEPKYLSRYFVVKHSWHGRYKRILYISNHTLITLDPTTLSMTNSYDVSNDFESAYPIIGKDENALESNVNVRTAGHGKFKGMKFSSRYRASILTELHRIQLSRPGTLAEFPVLRLRRKTSEWAPLLVKLFFLIVFLLPIACADLNSDKQALLAFANVVPHGRKLNCSKNTSICTSWVGINCTSDGSRVFALVILLGVAACTLTDVSFIAKGFMAAFIAVWTTALQHYGIQLLKKLEKDMKIANII